MNTQDYISSYIHTLDVDPKNRFQPEPFFEDLDVSDVVRGALTEISRKRCLDKCVHKGLTRLKDVVLPCVKYPKYLTHTWTLYAQALDEPAVIKNLFGSSRYAAWYLSTIGNKLDSSIDTTKGIFGLDELTKLFTRLPERNISDLMAEIREYQAKKFIPPKHNSSNMQF